jgi:hypothetical protein
MRTLRRARQSGARRSRQTQRSRQSVKHVSTRIERDIRSKTFDALVLTLRCKDAYITLAGALGISRDGTVEEPNTRIKEIPRRSHASRQQFPTSTTCRTLQQRGGIRILHPTAILVVFNPRSPRPHPPLLLHYHSSSRDAPNRRFFTT